MVKRIFKEFGRRRPDELITALLAMPPVELARGIGDLYAAGELRLMPARRRARNLCTKFYAYHKANPHVADWFLQAAQSLKTDEKRKRYGIGALTEQIRWNVKIGIIKTENFKISNDIRACYVRMILMRDPSLCGLFTIKSSEADALVVDGRTWLDFASGHSAELWPERSVPKKPAASVHPSEDSESSFGS